MRLIYHWEWDLSDLEELIESLKDRREELKNCKECPIYFIPGYYTIRAKVCPECSCDPCGRLFRQGQALQLQEGLL